MKVNTLQKVNNNKVYYVRATVNNVADTVQK